MTDQEVLLLGREGSSALVEAVFEVGHTPRRRGTMREALRQLDLARFAGIVVDWPTAQDFDALEFVLNARDIDSQVPIIILQATDAPAASPELVSIPNTFVLHSDRRLDRLAKALRLLLVPVKTSSAAVDAHEMGSEKGGPQHV